MIKLTKKQVLMLHERLIEATGGVRQIGRRRYASVDYFSRKGTIETQTHLKPSS